MTEPSMLERMVRAVSREMYEVDSPSDAMERATCTTVARAVLDELSSPDEAMIEAGASTAGIKAVEAMIVMQAARGYPLPASAFPNEESPLAQAWQAMISQAKKGAE